MADPLAPLRAYQGDECAVCRQERPLVVDHDHQTNLVRGLLCRSCNTSEGNGVDYPWMVEYRATPPTALLGLVIEYGKHLATATRGGRRPMFERWLVHLAEHGAPACPEGEDPTVWDGFCRWATIVGQAIRGWDEQHQAEGTNPPTSYLAA